MFTHHLFVFIKHDPGEHSPLAIHTAEFVHVLVLLNAGLALCYGESDILTILIQVGYECFRVIN